MLIRQGHIVYVGPIEQVLFAHARGIAGQTGTFHYPEIAYNNRRFPDIT